MTSEKKTKPKLKRKFISLQQKIDILDQLNNGKKSTAIAKDLGLNESTIRTILQNESKIRNAVMSRSLQTLSKSSRIKDSLIPKTEKSLMIWIEDCNQKNIPLNNSIIKAKAQKIFTHLKELETVSSDKSKFKFVSSNGWFERFRKRFSLHNIQIQGESASEDYETPRFKEEVPEVTDGGGYKAEDLDEEELVQLADTSDSSIKNSAEESLMQSTGEVEETICIENLNKIVELGKQLELLVANCDSCAERTTEFKINLQHCLAPYVDMQKNHKIPKEESFDTEIIIKVEPEEMIVDWGNLPLLPLGCVLGHLDTKDALVASTVCRHWRSALLMFGARMDTLKLTVSKLEKSSFLTSVFRKKVRQVYIYIDSNFEEIPQFMSNVLTHNSPDRASRAGLALSLYNMLSLLETFCSYVLFNSLYLAVILPILTIYLAFYDMKMIKEITFCGPVYLQDEYYSPVFMLKRETLESLPFKNLESLLVMGCAISPLEATEEEERVCFQRECDPLALSFNNVFAPKDVSLDTASSALSMLQNVTIDYDRVSTELVTCLLQLKHFKYLNMNITNNTNLKRKPVDWSDLNESCTNGFNICVNMICVPERKFNTVMSNVLVKQLPLTSMKVMFCKTLYLPLIKQLTHHYKKSLRELVWVDSPFDPVGDKDILDIEIRDDAYEMFNMNPLVLLCWQCNQLQRLVLHGYWIWHYDLVGCVRLRPLEQLEVSAVEVREAQYLRLRGGSPGHVLATDSHGKLDRDILHHINKYMNVKWKPRSWRKLHRAVRGLASHKDRLDFVLHEAKQTYSVV